LIDHDQVYKDKNCSGMEIPQIANTFKAFHFQSVSFLESEEKTLADSTMASTSYSASSRKNGKYKPAS
jgi:hypothetical protein